MQKMRTDCWYELIWFVYKNINILIYHWYACIFLFQFPVLGDMHYNFTFTSIELWWAWSDNRLFYSVFLTLTLFVYLFSCSYFRSTNYHSCDLPFLVTFNYVRFYCFNKLTNYLENEPASRYERTSDAFQAQCFYLVYLCFPFSFLSQPHILPQLYFSSYLSSTLFTSFFLSSF